MTLWTRQPKRGRRVVPDTAAAWVPVVADPPGAPVTTPDIAHAVRLFTAGDAIVGTIVGTGRLSDVLNLRSEIRIEDASIRPYRGSIGDGRVARELVLDPFEVDVAMASRLPDAPWTRARRVHKVQYPVRIEAGAYGITGVVHVFPGADPSQVARTMGALFLAVTGAVVRRDGRVISDPTVEVVLVNRHLVKRIVQADAAEVVDVPGLLVARRVSLA